MTKAELLKLLEPFSDDAIVVVEGYESGFDDIGGADKVVIQSVDWDWWHGRYQFFEDGEEPEGIVVDGEAVALKRTKDN